MRHQSAKNLRPHAKRLDQPVHNQSNTQSLGLFADIFDACKVNIDHHRINHHPDKNRHHQIDTGIFKGCNGLEGRRHQNPKPDPDSNAQGNPKGEIPLEDAEWGRCFICHQILFLFFYGLQLRIAGQSRTTGVPEQERVLPLFFCTNKFFIFENVADPEINLLPRIAGKWCPRADSNLFLIPIIYLILNAISKSTVYHNPKSIPTCIPFSIPDYKRSRTCFARKNGLVTWYCTAVILPEISDGVFGYALRFVLLLSPMRGL